MSVTAPKATADLVKRPWSSEEDALLAEVWPEVEDVEEAHALFDRSPQSVQRRAHELEVPRPKNRPYPGKVVSPVIVRDGVAGKACTGPCREWRPLEKFAHHATCAGGRRNTCTTCNGRIARANPNFRVKNVAAVEAYRSRLLAAPGEGVSAVEVRILFELYPLCAYCKQSPSVTLDHVVPISRGGAHEFANLLPACRSCNSSKNALTLEEWQARKGVR